MRVILEHPDGRRIAAEEDILGDPAKNPYNHGGPILQFNSDTGSVASINRLARPADDHVSLLDEGFVIVGEFATEDLYDEAGVQIAFKGVSEVARDPDLYARKGIDKASRPTALGKAIADRGLNS